MMAKGGRRCRRMQRRYDNWRARIDAMGKAGVPVSDLRRLQDLIAAELSRQFDDWWING